MKRAFIVLVASALLSGCDPGWSYRLRGSDARPYARLGHKLTVPDDVSATLSVSMFASLMSLDLQIVNNGTTPLTIEPEKLELLDAKGKVLKPERIYSGREKDARSAVLSPGQGHLISAVYHVNPLVGGPLMIANRRLKYLKLSFKGLSRAGHPVPVDGILEWSL